MDTAVKQSVLNVQSFRKNPLLILDLKEVKRDSALYLEKKLHNKYFKVLDVLLQTPGGSADAAYTITKLLRKHASKVNILVPLYAKSAGTLICLCANEIVMSEISELGPLDTQIMQSRQGDVNYKSALDGLKALEQIQFHALENLDMATKLIYSKSGLKMIEAIDLGVQFSGVTSGCLYSQLDPMAIGEYKRALDISQRYGYLILNSQMGWEPDKAREVVYHLIYNYPSHDSVIELEELKNLELPATLVQDKEWLGIRDLSLLLSDLEESTIELVQYNTIRNRKEKKNAKKK